MDLWKALRLLFWMTFLTGGVYPLLVTTIAHLGLNHKAEGSLLIENGTPIGSLLIGQAFNSDQYFWPRPSATDYNTLNSGGSNWGPTSMELKKAVEMRREHIEQTSFGAEKHLIPSELLFASGSGLDPHISVRTAYFQVARVSKARGMSEETLKNLVDIVVEKRRLGFLGAPYVNVLRLNNALDQLHRSSSQVRE